MDKKLLETANLCVELMNGKRQVKGKLGLWYKFAFAVWRKRDGSVLTSAHLIFHFSNENGKKEILLILIIFTYFKVQN